MKEINTRAMLKAYKELRIAESYWGTCVRNNYSCVDRAKEDMDSKKAAYNELATPLTEAIKNVEGRASVRTIDASDVLDALITINEKLSIPVKHMDGITAEVDLHSQKFPHSYFSRAHRTTPMSTQFRAVFKSGAWRIVYIDRDPVRQINKGKFALTLTETAREAIISNYTNFN